MAVKPSGQYHSVFKLRIASYIKLMPAKKLAIFSHKPALVIDLFHCHIFKAIHKQKIRLSWGSDRAYDIVNTIVPCGVESCHFYCWHRGNTAFHCNAQSIIYTAVFLYILRRLVISAEHYIVRRDMIFYYPLAKSSAVRLYSSLSYQHRHSAG